ncbi:MAG TPA: apolipoprotein N-acyltransferase [Rhodospirillales bacterium]|nr:apolipoprotein N-acyltransferase [Rhodospirillales bacterium]
MVRERDWGGHIGPTVLAGVLLAGLWGIGLARLGAAPALGQNTVPGVVLRLVQPNIAQQDKWKPGLRVGNLKDQIAMSMAPAPGPSPTHVIWSETAATYYLSADYPVRRAIAQAVPKGGLILTGAPRITTAGEKPLKIWNSLYALDDRGDIVGTYDKSHLVPFGEYMPLRNITGLDKIVGKGTDFSPGPGVRTLRLPGLPPVSPLICYEVIFPGNVVDPEDRPEWMLNITNDAWYGTSTGPYQHFDAARFRAVEQGLPLVRVANTGISGVIDSYGRVVKQLNLGQKGSLDSALPKALTATVFSRYGNVLALLLMVATGVLGMVMGRRRGS